MVDEWVRICAKFKTVLSTVYFDCLRLIFDWMGSPSLCVCVVFLLQPFHSLHFAFAQLLCSFHCLHDDKCDCVQMFLLCMYEFVARHHLTLCVHLAQNDQTIIAFTQIYSEMRTVSYVIFIVCAFSFSLPWQFKW